MSRPELMQHQASGIEFLSRAGRGLLADDPGLGKSRQLIEASRGSTLVVAPAGVINGGTWEDEIARWADDPSRFQVMSYHALAAKKARGTQFETLIFDEAHYLKGRKTKWTVEALPLAANTKRVYLATGTPISNWAHELFSLLQLLDPPEARPGRKLGSYWRWAEQWFRVAPGRFTQYEIGELRACRLECGNRPAWDPCEHYAQFMEDNLGGRFLTRRRENVLDLPPVTYQTVLTPMDSATRKTYNQLKKEYLAELEDGTELIAWSAGSRQVALDRLTTSPYLLLDVNARAKVPVGGGKLDQLREDLTNRPRPTLVLAHYQDTVNACANVAHSLGMRPGVVHGGVDKDRARAFIRRFQAGELDVLCGSLETIAEGLTLTAADMCIFVEQSYKPYRNVQAMHRIHRMGQTRPVTVRRYLTPRSVDSNRQKLLDSKTDHQMRMLSARDFAKLL